VQPARYRPLSISQNFLHSRALVDRLLDASSVRAGDLVFDLGAGHGLISERLAQRGCRVVVVEKDVELAAHLHARLNDTPTVHVRQADMLSLPLPRQPYKVFANIPFNATAAIVNRLTQARHPPEDSYLVVQAEAADRFIGQPGGTLISALFEPWFEPTLVHHFDRTDFAPAPRVDAVMLRLRKRGPPLVPVADTGMYRDFVVSVFAGRHRSVQDNLRDLVGWQRARRTMARLRLDPTSTASEVSLACWLDLFEVFRAAAAQSTVSGVVGAERRLVRQQQRLRKPQRTSSRSSPGAVIECRPPPLAVCDSANPILPAAAVLWDSRVSHVQRSWSAPWILRGECGDRADSSEFSHKRMGFTKPIQEMMQPFHVRLACRWRISPRWCRRTARQSPASRSHG
jgi:23S rRNA (adenine-N6)-dimethyltransferase